MAFPSFKKWLDKLPPRVLRLGINLWPPFFGSGIKVVSMDTDFCHITVALKSRLLNKNYVGTHFGGSIFAMCDPFFMLILLKHLGKDYIVWDKAAHIEFKKPGRGTLTATCALDEHDIQTIRKQADAQGKYLFSKSIDVLNKQGEVIATVLKTLYIKRKK